MLSYQEFILEVKKRVPALTSAEQKTVKLCYSFSASRGNARACAANLLALRSGGTSL